MLFEEIQKYKMQNIYILFTKNNVLFTGRWQCSAQTWIKSFSESGTNVKINLM